MRRPTDIDPRTTAIDRLVQAGRAAMPDPTTIAELHLGSVSEALASERSRVRRSSSRIAGRVPRRRLIVAGAMATLVAIPTLAFADALPDPVQRVASTVAGVVGVDVPSPRSEQAGSRGNAGGSSAEHRGDAGSGDANDSSNGTAGSDGATGSSDGTTPPSGDEQGHVNGTRPGKPEDGEQRGNRFGQVPGGPDQGAAGEPHGADPNPATSSNPPKPAPPKPAKDPGPVTPKPATPAPVTPAPVEPAPVTPVPVAPAPGGGNGNAGGNGNGR